MILKFKSQKFREFLIKLKRFVKCKDLERGKTWIFTQNPLVKISILTNGFCVKMV